MAQRLTETEREARNLERRVRDAKERGQQQQQEAETLTCAQEEKDPVGTRGGCGADRDCLPFVGEEPNMAAAWCNGLAWLAKHPTRTYEITKYGTGRRWRLTNRVVTRERQERCGHVVAGQVTVPPGSNSEPEQFDIQVPGLTDILRLPGLETKDVRRERARRARAHRSALPEGARWITGLLNKLDNAQDLIYTAAALSIPIARWLGVRMIPGLGAILTANDLLNAFT